jgi:hypothetical protein
VAVLRRGVRKEGRAGVDLLIQLLNMLVNLFLLSEESALLEMMNTLMHGSDHDKQMEHIGQLY